MNTLRVFEYQENPTSENFVARTIEDNGEIWIVAKDVAKSLGYSMAGSMQSMFAHVPDIWKGGKRIATPGGEQEMLCLTEQGLYFFLGRSDKKAALPYQMWISGDVVPSIRKHGFYATPSTVEDILKNPDNFIQVLQAFKEEQRKNEELQQQINENRPNVIFAEAVDSSKNSILIGNLAKLLCQNGIKVGQNKLFCWLREHGFLISCRGERWNMPMQTYVDQGLFELKKSIVNNPDGTTKVTHTTKVTGKGQIYFINGFLSGKFII